MPKGRSTEQGAISDGYPRRPGRDRHRLGPRHRSRARARVRRPRAPRSSSTTSAARSTARAATSSPGEESVDDIKAMGGEAVANGDDVADFEGAGRLVQSAIDAFGRLDVRRQQRRHPARPDARQHGRGRVGRGHQGAPEGHFGRRSTPPRTGATSRRPVEPVDAADHQHPSPSGIFGNVGPDQLRRRQGRHRGVHRHRALELGRYGVTVNAIAPAARTRMTEDLGMGPAPEGATVRRARPGEHLAARRVARLAGVEGRHRPRVPRRRRPDLRRRGLAARADRGNDGCAGIRRRSARSFPTSSRRPSPTPR